MKLLSLSFDPVGSFTPDPVMKAIFDEVEVALAAEPDPYREAFMAVHRLMSPDSPDDIATKYGISRQQVYNRSNVVKNRLRRRFA